VKEGNKTTKFTFQIREDLQTAQDPHRLYDDDEEQLRITIANDDLVKARKEGNALKLDRSGPKLAKFSKELLEGDSITIGLQKKDGKREVVGATVINDHLTVVNDGSMRYTNDLSGKQYRHSTNIKMNDKYGTEGKLVYSIFDDLDASLNIAFEDFRTGYATGRVVSID